jgi:hypothetical protein
MKPKDQEIGGPGTGEQPGPQPGPEKEPTGIVKHTGKPQPPVAVPSEDNSIPALMRLALQQAGPDAVAALERLVALQVSIEERNAKKEFAGAMARFKAKLALTPILKDKTQTQGSDAGSSFAMTWASAASIARTIDPILAEFGLSYKWAYKIEGTNLATTCRATHENGHYEETTVVIPTTSRAGMSEQQKMSSAQAYGDRLSLIGVFGLTTAEQDAPKHSFVDPTPITKEQADALTKKIGAGGVSLQKFLAAMNLTSVVEIPAVRLNEANLIVDQAIQAKKERAATEKKP